MGDKSAIEWTEATWNPVTGCSKVSPGCAHCYAERLAPRLHRMGQEGYTDLPWTPENASQNVILHPDRLDQPLRWKRPRMIFVNSMSDLFHEEVPEDFVARVFAVMALARQHTFQVLTKRPERMLVLLRSWSFCKAYMAAVIELGDGRLPNSFILADEFYDGAPLPNVWLGVSIENRSYVHRADLLRETPAAVRFISAEPLLGPLLPLARVDGDRATAGLPQFVWEDDKGGDCPGLDLTHIDWLIVGGESGLGHRPMREDWVFDLLDACLAIDAHVPIRHLPEPPERLRPAFFFKQWGGAAPKAGGRELEGRTWDEFPQVHETVAA